MTAHNQNSNAAGNAAMMTFDVPRPKLLMSPGVQEQGLTVAIESNVRHGGRAAIPLPPIVYGGCAESEEGKAIKLKSATAAWSEAACTGIWTG